MKEPDSMREIHEIMEKLHDKRKFLTEEEILNDIRDGAEKLKAKYGLKIEKVQRLKPLEFTNM